MPVFNEGSAPVNVRAAFSKTPRFSSVNTLRVSLRRLPIVAFLLVYARPSSRCCTICCNRANLAMAPLADGNLADHHA